MSSSAIFPNFVANDSFEPRIDAHDLNDIEAIIDSWFPESAGEPLLIGALADANILDTTASVQLPFSPPFFQSGGSDPAVRINEEERFIELPSTTSAAEESPNDIAEQLSSRKKR